MNLPPVKVHDIDDAEGFVIAAVQRSGLRLHRQEREELVAEGLVCLFDLARRYRPRLDGYTQDGSFAGYAANLLPRKLLDCWHRLHPEHVMRTQPDGTRRYEYLAPPDSLDARLEENERSADAPGSVQPIREEDLRTPGAFVQPPRAA